MYLINYFKFSKQIFFVYTFILILLVFPLFYLGHTALSQNTTGNSTIEDLNEDIGTIKQKIKDLENEKARYEKDVNVLRGERLSLDREIAILNNRIAQKQIDIETEQAKIDQTSLEVQVVEDDILSTEKVIKTKKEQLSLVLDKLEREGEIDYFELFILNNSFTDLFDTIKNLETIQNDVYKLVVDVKEQKKELEEKKIDLEEKKNFQERSKMTLEENKIALEEQQGAKKYLIAETRYSERRFQGLIANIKLEQDNANADIVSLEKEIRERLNRDTYIGLLGADEAFSWPVDSRLITARFHDPSYPYRYIFEHPAIDIAIPQGSPVRVAKSGYVGRAKDAGLGYSYIQVIHDNGMSSVYGHVSAIEIFEDDFVVQGQIIGRSGGAPGSRGAGSFSTGAHLHFEIRQDGIPVNPENYLN